MTPERERLVIAPGPVHVPVMLRGAVWPAHHRSDGFRSIFRELEGMLRELLGSDAAVYIVTASGTGAMEAAAV